MPEPAAAALDPRTDVAELTRALVDIRSVSGDEEVLAGLVHTALAAAPHLNVTRDGNAVIARTELGRPSRVAIAGHLDTVPEAGNLPARVDGDTLFGLGSCDMKGGVAVALHLAATLTEPTHDVTYVFYDCEEVEAERNGLLRIARHDPSVLAADFAVLMEPTDGAVEGGCQGTLRVQLHARGRRAHSARAWMGQNAIHALGPALDVLRAYEPRRPVVDGLEFHEGLQAVRVDGGVAGNVVPDAAVLTVNHRFAPDRSPEEAVEHVRQLFADYEVTVTDLAAAARPGLDRPAARSFVDSVGGAPRAKHGWTDVARFAELGVPAVNYGPGDPVLAHTVDEHVSMSQIREVADRMRRWLTA